MELNSTPAKPTYIPFIIESVYPRYSDDEKPFVVRDLLIKGLNEIKPTIIGLSDLNLTCPDTEHVFKDIKPYNDCTYLDFSGNNMIFDKDKHDIFNCLKLLRNVFPNAMINLAQKDYQSTCCIEFLEFIKKHMKDQETFLMDNFSYVNWGYRPLKGKIDEKLFEISKKVLISKEKEELGKFYIKQKYEKLQPKIIGKLYRDGEDSDEEFNLSDENYKLDLSGETLENQTGRVLLCTIGKTLPNEITMVSLLERLKRDYKSEVLFSIETLDLSNNMIRYKTDLKLLIQFINDNIKCLNLLNLSGNYLERNLANPLAKLIIGKKVKTINISRNKNRDVNSSSLFDDIIDIIDRKAQYRIENHDKRGALSLLMKMFPFTYDEAESYYNETTKKHLTDYTSRIIYKI